MQNNNPNNYLQEDEIDLKEIFKLLINSKKLIIAITLVITTLGAIYAFQKTPVYKSTALIEIGYYGQDEQILIETAKNLIQELKINFIYTQGEDLSIKSFENRLIKIAHSSTSSVTSNNLLNELVTFAENRHILLLSKRTQKAEKILTNKIESLNKQIVYSKLRVSNKIESLYKQIENRIITLDNELPNIDLKIKALNSIIFEDQNNLTLLKSNPDLLLQRAAQSPTLNQVIHSYKNQLLDFEAEKINISQEKYHLESQLSIVVNNTDEIFKLSHEKDDLESQLTIMESTSLESDEIFKLSQEKDGLELELEFLMNQNQTSTQLIGEIVTTAIESKKERFIFLSFIFGLFLSIIMVFINNFVKTFKEEQV